MVEALIVERYPGLLNPSGVLRRCSDYVPFWRRGASRLMHPPVQGLVPGVDADGGMDPATESLAETHPADGGSTLDVSVLRAVIAMQHELAAVGLDLKAVMQRIADRTRELTAGTAAAVRLLDGDALVCGATSGAPEIARPHRLPLGDNLSGHAMRSGRSLLCLDTETDERVDSALSRSRGVRSIIAVPLLHAGEAVGLLLLYGDEAGAFGERDVTTMELLSVVLSAAMAHAAEFEAKRDQVQALARFEATFAGALTGMLLMDLDGQIIDSNPAIQELLGHSHGELEGRRTSEFVHPDDRHEARSAYLRLIADDGSSLRMHHRFLGRDGEVLWVDVSASLVRDSDGRKSFAITMIQDITQRKEAEAALLSQSAINEHQALHDALTGLANRTLFRERIEHAVKAKRHTDARAAVLVMDLDGFKEINDSLGHAAGDDLLVELARRLEAALRSSDTVARLGGDEFGVLLPHASVPDDVVRALERMQAAIEDPITLQGLSLSLEASIGIALCPDDGKDVETLLQCADGAMYHAKEEKSGWAFCDSSRVRKDTARLTLMGELRGALDQRELVLHYQPKAVLADGEVHAVEALLRWNHPARGLVPPDDFIPMAQQTGLIKPLTLYVIDEALRQCRSWQDVGLGLAIAVNLSVRNLVDTDFPSQVAGLLERWSVEPGLLEFEITESAMLADPTRTKLILEQLAGMGIRLSIDDFGTGYSSLAYLKRLPVSEIKVDRSFVMNMAEDEDDATIVRSTIDLGRNLGLDVVAEGVESKQVWNRLKALGCTAAQGYFLSRALPAPELTAWLLQRRAGSTPRSANSQLNHRRRRFSAPRVD
jgi:diguanylate cyclase (GGDEF)-like protein/PAS domain S-box-containing protein